MIAADAATIVTTYLLADVLRCHLWLGEDWPELHPVFGSTERIHMKMLVFLPFAWPFILSRLGWYEQKWRRWHWAARHAVLGTLVLGLLMSALALLLERGRYPRAQIGIVALLLPATTLAMRGITTLIGRREGGRRQRHVLIVGAGRDAVRLRRLLRTAAFGRPSVVGHLRPPWETSDSWVETGALLGGIDALGPILDDRAVDEVFFSVPAVHLGEVLPLVRLCEEVGVTVHVQAESIVCHSIPEMVDFHGVPLLVYAPARHLPEMLAVKRALDLLLASVLILLTGPIMLLCALAIKLTAPGPVLFRQRRSGLYGRPFDMYKFRTMEPDAEARQAEIAHLNEASGPVFKVRCDPRVTWVGSFLRRWSLDELPQLFNVLRGEMAIVGPRPPIPAEVEKYDRWQRRRLSMRPGLTCLWQIKGRHRIGFQEWMQLDLFYIDHWSLRLDFLIMFRTIPTVLGGTGA